MKRSYKKEEFTQPQLVIIYKNEIGKNLQENE